MAEDKPANKLMPNKFNKSNINDDWECGFAVSIKKETPEIFYMNEFNLNPT